MGKGLSIVGTGQEGNKREKHDFYPTPGYVTDALLKREKFVGITREPACGDGAMSKRLEVHGLSVISTDLIDRGYGEGGKDFLDRMFCHFDPCNNIITNPPFSLAQQFVMRAKEIATDKIALFLKTTFLASGGRKAMFLDKKFPLKTVYQFSNRVTLYKEVVIEEKQNKGMIEYAWYVWDRSHKGPAFIDWI